jgi:hypothetical protein
MDPLTVTAYATASLAFIAGVSIVANIYLARATSRAARAAQASTVNQETELGLLKRQLELAEKQYETAQETARPKLRAAIISYGTLYTAGQVRYVNGSEPAYAVEIWIRGTPAQGETWGLRTCPVAELMVPGETVSFTANPATAAQQDHLPFDGFLNQPEPPYGVVLVGLTWKRPDETVDKLVEPRPVHGVTLDPDLFKA